MHGSETRIFVQHEGQRVDITPLLHPSGACTCAHEGQCEWCHKHCLHCGAEETHEIHHTQICGEPFGKEILLWGMMPGDGMQAICMREAGHKGEHADPEMGPHAFESVAQVCADL